MDDETVRAREEAYLAFLAEHPELSAARTGTHFFKGGWDARQAGGDAEEAERLKQIESLVSKLALVDHLHTRKSLEFDHAYYRLMNALVGNPWLAPGEPNPLASQAATATTRTGGEGGDPDRRAVPYLRPFGDDPIKAKDD